MYDLRMPNLEVKVAVLCGLGDFKEVKNLSWKMFVKIMLLDMEGVLTLLGCHKTVSSGLKGLAELKI